MFACFLTFLYPSQIELARTLWRFLLRICFGHCVVFQDGCRSFGHFPTFLTKFTWWFSNLYNWTLVHALTETGRGRFSTNGAAGNTSPTVLLLNVNIQSIDHVKRYKFFHKNCTHPSMHPWYHQEAPQISLSPRPCKLASVNRWVVLSYVLLYFAFYIVYFSTKATIGLITPKWLSKMW